MDAEQFRKYGHQLIDFIADYHENLDKINVRNPNCKFGDVIRALPKEAPRGLFMSCYKLYKSKTSFYLQKYKKESKNVEL
jgi:hypothetical protein